MGALTTEEFIKRWSVSAGAEHSNSQLFLTDLCSVLEVEPPRPAVGNDILDIYIFEKPVPILGAGGKKSTRRMDLYKAGHFIWESKQSSVSGSKKKGSATRNTPGYNIMMQDAQGQALGYARSIDEPPPFLLVGDIGYCVDVYASFDGSTNYRAFPHSRGCRLFFQDFAKHKDLLKNIFTDPMSLDPSRQAAKVTKEISEKLAALALQLEALAAPEVVARFLMRCLFTMFAEDAELLPERVFTDSIKTHWIKSPKSFVDGVEALWKAMNDGTAFGAQGKLLRFNGGLFHEAKGLPLQPSHLRLLLEAAERDWREVEPAIFGTLLERALDPKERHRLGAHYTPRAYVERLVRPTIEEPLRAEWEVVQAESRRLVLGINFADKKKKKENDAKLKVAQEVVQGFHHKLCQLRILDPACGSGNFLYVALDLLKRLEGEVLAFLTNMGERHWALDTEGKTITVTPEQFLGIEVKPWAKEIADLVLWIGYLQWHLRTYGKKAHPPEPILRDYHNIECRDAVLAYDEKQIVLNEKGEPLTRWDGETYKQHPVTKEEVPDESARVGVYRYTNPKKAEWPRADFIVGNPPFVGNKRMRNVLGDGYAEALRGVYKEVPETVDYVMYWWEKAASLLQAKKIQRFGFITTNSITQTFSRKVLQRYLDVEGRKEGANDVPISLVFAIPDHPWVDSISGAAVRISMTSCQFGDLPGLLHEVQKEEDLGGEDIQVTLRTRKGKIHPDLSIGPNVSGVSKLRSNAGLCFMGVTLVGEGFRVSPDNLIKLNIDKKNLPGVVRGYLTGRDVAQKTEERYVIDFFGCEESKAKSDYPELYQWLRERVIDERQQNKRKQYKDRWWIFGEPRANMRIALAGLGNYLATPETSKHRFFSRLSEKTIPDHSLFVIAIDDFFYFGVLCSRVHSVWALAAGSTLEDRPRYRGTSCFDPFPFPMVEEGQRAKIRKLAEELDAHRKARQALHPKLTMTGMYNVLEKLRAGEALDDKEIEINNQGLVSILQTLHDELDQEVLRAYGWIAGKQMDTAVSSQTPRSGMTDKAVTPVRSEAQTAGSISVQNKKMDTAVSSQTRSTGMTGGMDTAVSHRYDGGGKGGNVSTPEPPKVGVLTTGPGLTDEEILTRLVALNAARAEEERNGVIRWLRPEFQNPAGQGTTQTTLATDEPEETTAPSAAAVAWPKKFPQQLTVVRDLTSRGGAWTIPQVLASFKGAAVDAVEDVLESLSALGIMLADPSAKPGESRWVTVKQ